MMVTDSTGYKKIVLEYRISFLQEEMRRAETKQIASDLAVTVDTLKQELLPLLTIPRCTVCGSYIGECDGYCTALPNELDDESERI